MTKTKQNKKMMIGIGIKIGINDLDELTKSICIKNKIKVYYY